MGLPTCLTKACLCPLSLRPVFHQTGCCVNVPFGQPAGRTHEHVSIPSIASIASICCPAHPIVSIACKLWPTEAQEFKKKFEEVQEMNAKLITAPATTEEDEEDKAADELAKEVEEKAAV